MKAAIHVGLQKTASTMLQRNLHHNRSSLAKEGVGYVRLRPLNETADVIHLPAFTSTIRAIAMPNRQSPDDARVEAELRWLRESGWSSVILTDENVLGPINHESGRPAYPRAVEVMRWMIDRLRPTSYVVVVYVRRQDTYLESTYLHRIHIGKSIGFQEYEDRTDIGSFDWLDLARRLVDVVGREHLRVVPYETIRLGEQAFLNRFLSLAGIDLRLDQDHLAPRISNRSYSDLALQMALRCNELLEGADLRAFRDFLQTEYSNATHSRPVLLDEDRRAQIVARFADSNRTLLDEFVAPADRVDDYR